MFIVYAAFVCLAIASVADSSSEDDVDAEDVLRVVIEESTGSYTPRGWGLEAAIRMSPREFELWQIERRISKITESVCKDVTVVVERKLAENNSGYNLLGWLTLAMAIVAVGLLIFLCAGIGALLKNGAALLDKIEFTNHTIYMNANNQNTCVVCTDVCSKMYAPRRCGHVSCCETCIRGLQKCVICSEPFSKTICVQL